MHERPLQSESVADDFSPSAQRGLYATRNTLPLIARILLSALFIWSGVNKILNFESTQGYMAASGLPLTALLLVGAIIVEVGGGLSVLLGIYPRVGAAALATFTLIASFIFHTDFSDQMQQIMFMKNMAIIGGLLMIVQYGVGNIGLRLGQRR